MHDELESISEQPLPVDIVGPTVRFIVDTRDDATGASHVIFEMTQRSINDIHAAQSSCIEARERTATRQIDGITWAGHPDMDTCALEGVGTGVLHVGPELIEIVAPAGADGHSARTCPIPISTLAIEYMAAKTSYQSVVNLCKGPGALHYEMSQDRLIVERPRAETFG